MAQAADALPIEQVAARWIVATDPDAVIDQVRPYVEAGFTTWSSTPPATTRPASSTPSPATCSRGCGR